MQEVLFFLVFLVSTGLAPVERCLATRRGQADGFRHHGACRRGTLFAEAFGKM
jgi:hypothetical protein